MIIKHGIPKHDCFPIVLPTNVIKPTLDELEENYQPPVYEFEDPKTEEKFQGEIIKIATLSLTEFKNQSMLSLMAYGQPADKIIPELQRRYPEIHRTQKIHYVLIRKIESTL